MCSVQMIREKSSEKKDMAEDKLHKLIDLALKNNSYDVLIHICENEELDRLVRVVWFPLYLSLTLTTTAL